MKNKLKSTVLAMIIVGSLCGCGAAGAPQEGAQVSSAFTARKLEIVLNNPDSENKKWIYSTSGDRCVEEVQGDTSESDIYRKEFAPTSSGSETLQFSYVDEDNEKAVDRVYNVRIAVAGNAVAIIDQGEGKVPLADNVFEGTVNSITDKSITVSGAERSIKFIIEDSGAVGASEVDKGDKVSVRFTGVLQAAPRAEKIELLEKSQPVQARRVVIYGTIADITSSTVTLGLDSMTVCSFNLTRNTDYNGYTYRKGNYVALTYTGELAKSPNAVSIAYIGEMPIYSATPGAAESNVQQTVPSTAEPQLPSPDTRASGNGLIVDISGKVMCLRPDSLGYNIWLTVADGAIPAGYEPSEGDYVSYTYNSASCELQHIAKVGVVVDPNA